MTRRLIRVLPASAAAVLTLMAAACADHARNAAPAPAAAAQTASGPTTRETSGPSNRFAAMLKVKLDDSAATDYGVSADDVMARVRELEARPEGFTLEELQNLKIPTATGGSVLFQEVASVHIRFQPAGQ